MAANSIAEAAALAGRDVTPGDLNFQRSTQRLDRLNGLASLIAQGADDDALLREVGRLRLTDIRVVHLSRLAPVIETCLSDPVLVNQPITRAELAEVRAITLEDVECVFDFGTMEECAKALALFLLGRAREEGRFDDYRLASKIASLHVNGGPADTAGAVEITLQFLEYLLHSPALSAIDAAERVEQVTRLSDFLERAIDPALRLPALVELLAEAEGITAESFEINASVVGYGEARDRLDASFRATRNPAYLEDLLLLCSAERPDETQRERAGRLNDLAVYINERGRAFHRPGELELAVQVQHAACDLIDPADASWRRFRTNAAVYRVATIETRMELVSSYLEDLRADLPALPYETSMRHVSGIGAAYLARALVELMAATEPGDSHPDALSNAVESATAAETLITANEGQGNAHDARAVLTCATVLKLAREQAELTDEQTASLIELLSNPRLAESAYGAAVGVTRELIDTHPVLRPSLKKAIQAAHARTSTQWGERLLPTYNLLTLLVSLIRLGGEAGGSEESADEAIATAWRLLSVAFNLAVMGEGRSSSTGPLAAATRDSREIALQFVSSGRYEHAATLAQIASSMLATQAVALAEGTDDVVVRLADYMSAARCSCLVILTGANETALLIRHPGEPWSLASKGPSTWLRRFADIDWLLSEDGAFFELKKWVTETVPVLAELVGDALADLQARALAPVLCLPTGILMAYPLAAVSWVRPEVRLPLVLVPGLLTDGTADAVTEPTPDGPCVVVLAGAPTLSGEGSVNVARDIALIRATGLSLSIVESAAGDEWLNQSRYADILHYSGHMVPMGPDDTALVFDDGSAVPLAGLRSVDLRRTRVVTLISCFSAFGPSDAAEQVEHAAGAFLEAGASTVVACLWPVVDRPAALFIRAFYDSVGAGASIADAFAVGVEAIRWYRLGDIAPYDHPVYWAGFTLFAGAGSWLRPNSATAP
jgi:hypothetical protein